MIRLENDIKPGDRFERWTVVCRDRRRKGECYLCQCVCGTETIVLGRMLRIGKSLSCGCLRKEKTLAVTKARHGKNNLTGRRFEMVEVQRLGPTLKTHGDRLWECKCDCGRSFYASTYSLQSGRKKDCGCRQRERKALWKLKDLTGRRFDMLVVLNRVPELTGQGAKWHCQCDCGKTGDFLSRYLLHGKGRKSCGCHRRKCEVIVKQVELIKRERAEFIPDFIHAPDYLGVADQKSLLSEIRQMKKGWEFPAMPGGQPFSVKIRCWGARWTMAGYRPGDLEIPAHWVALAQFAIKDLSRQYDFDPQTAIVNFYGPEAKLGMHVDRQESPELLFKGSPIVTFALGDDAEFMVRHPQTKKILDFSMQSGDLVVFHGKARNCEHGIRRIIPGTSPFPFPGRLSITFRQVR